MITKRPKIKSSAEFIDEVIRAAPRGRPWYDSEDRRWTQPIHLTKRAVKAAFLAYRRQRAALAMAELEAQIAREKAAERRRRARRKYAKRPRSRRAAH